MTQRPDLSLRAFLGEGLAVLTDVDNKLFRSVAYLLARPGRLTAEWAAGRHVRYLHPLKLFLLVNVIFFVLTPRFIFNFRLESYLDGDAPFDRLRIEMVERKIAELGVDEQQYAERFNRALDIQKKLFIILLVPIYTLGIALLHWRSRRFFLEHLVFATHTFAALLLHMAVIMPVLFFGIWGGLNLLANVIGGPLTGVLQGYVEQDEAVKAVLLLVPAFLYLTRALATVYGGRLLALRAAVLTALIPFLFDAYVDLLFFPAFVLT